MRGPRESGTWGGCWSKHLRSRSDQLDVLPGQVGALHLGGEDGGGALVDQGPLGGGHQALPALLRSVEVAPDDAHQLLGFLHSGRLDRGDEGRSGGEDRRGDKGPTFKGVKEGLQSQ